MQARSGKGTPVLRIRSLLYILFGLAVTCLVLGASGALDSLSHMLARHRREQKLNALRTRARFLQEAWVSLSNGEGFSERRVLESNLRHFLALRGAVSRRYAVVSLNGEFCVAEVPRPDDEGVCVLLSSGDVTFAWRGTPLWRQIRPALSIQDRRAGVRPVCLSRRRGMSAWRRGSTWVLDRSSSLSPSPGR